MHEALVFPGNDEDFAINGGDYLIVYDMLSKFFEKAPVDLWVKVSEMVTISESDEFTNLNCHVYAIDKAWDILTLTFVTLTNW